MPRLSIFSIASKKPHQLRKPLLQQQLKLLEFFLDGKTILCSWGFAFSKAACWHVYQQFLKIGVSPQHVSS